LKIILALVVFGALPTVIVRGEDKLEPSIDVAIAWKLEGISGATLGATKSDPVFRQGAALLEAAARLAPQEPRFPRLRVLALQHIGDTDGAIAALKQYRKLAPADRRAQLQLIDLYASKIETVDARVEYLTSLLDKQDVPAEVRAQVAVELTGLLAQKSPELAAAMATRAVQLYPLAQATRLYYHYVGRKQEALPKRVAALLAVLKADPNQPIYLDELATLLANNGLSDASLLWYDAAIYTALNSGGPPSGGVHALEINYVAEASIAGRLAYADTKAGQLLDRSPLDPDAWFLKLTVDKAASPEVFARQIDPARDAFIRRWNSLHEEILTGHPATQPAVPEAVLPGDEKKVVPLDPAPVLEKLKDGSNPRGTAAAVSVISDLAWFYLYFDPKPEEAGKWLEALRPLLQADSVPLQRLEGWLQLVSGDVRKAMQILTPVADKDALAQFGFIQCDRAAKNPVEPARITKLLEENRIGVVAAILWAALKTDATRPTTRPAADEVIVELNKFPGPLLGILDPSTASRLYGIRAEPVVTSIPFGDPVLAEVIVYNTSDYDITIGNDAMLRPELWFDARTLGIDQQSMRGVAADEIGNEIVLRPHTSTSQLVRLDAGELHRALVQSPGSAMTVNCWVTTNPFTYRDPSTNEGFVSAGPGGQRVNFNRTFTYKGIPVLLPSGKRDFDEASASKDPVDRLHAIDVLAGYQRMALLPGTEDSVRQAAASLQANVASMRKDPSPMVAGWASYLAAAMAGGEERAKIVAEMAASPDWATRLLSLFAGDSLPIARQKEIATGLLNDSDATVKSAAAATIEVLDQTPDASSTQPAGLISPPGTTQPAP
jgi:tetratricopeptide (TPR) repeat protein